MHEAATAAEASASPGTDAKAMGTVAEALPALVELSADGAVRCAEVVVIDVVVTDDHGATTAAVASAAAAGVAEAAVAGATNAGAGATTAGAGASTAAVACAGCGAAAPGAAATATAAVDVMPGPGDGGGGHGGASSKSFFPSPPVARAAMVPKGIVTVWRLSSWLFVADGDENVPRASACADTVATADSAVFAISAVGVIPGGDGGDGIVVSPDLLPTPNVVRPPTLPQGAKAARRPPPGQFVVDKGQVGDGGSGMCGDVGDGDNGDVVDGMDDGVAASKDRLLTPVVSRAEAAPEGAPSAPRLLPGVLVADSGGAVLGASGATATVSAITTTATAIAKAKATDTVARKTSAVCYSLLEGSFATPAGMIDVVRRRSWGGWLLRQRW